MSKKGFTIVGDYQTEKRMKQKREAIPLPDLKGKRVLDIGCDHGYWCQLASTLGASHVVGVDRGRFVRGAGGEGHHTGRHVRLAEQNNQQGWPNCKFVEHNLGKEWPMLGRFDVVFCFSVYHHWYPMARDHDACWDWLHQHTAPAGMILWEGPTDTKDPIIRQRLREENLSVNTFTREIITTAAEHYFKIEIVGPAIHRPHREVWRCSPK